MGVTIKAGRAALALPRLLAAGCAAIVVGAATLPARADSALPSEIPAHFTDVTKDFDYIRRDAMIPMRDGVKLFTVILIKKGVRDAPMLLTRTPYGAASRFEHASSHLAVLEADGDVADELVWRDGYIRVLQDIRGKKGSQGDFVMNRPVIGPLNPTTVDESTDAYDTIEWLIHNVPESNGRVGILGISYDGFTSLMALHHAHPALHAAVPINAMVDGWKGDDWFHNGAFRVSTWNYVYEEQTTRGSDKTWWTRSQDEYDDAIQAGSAGELGLSRGLDQLGFFRKVVEHPDYDAFWQNQAVDKLLAAEPLTVPTMLVHSLWDQEDIYGNIAVWTALKPHDANHNLYLTIGPWFHHQERLDGSAIGAIGFGSDTAAWWRANVLKPFLDRNLRNDAAAPPVATVTAFQTGANRWQTLSAWPACAAAPGCRVQPTPIYLHPDLSLSFSASAGAAHGTTYVADPAHPVPFIPRPVHLSGDAGEAAWQHWLVSDQRELASRPDVLSYQTPALTAPITLAGKPLAHIVQRITGTDVDVVVKLIDVAPDEAGRDPALGGYQLMVAADILRGRYRADPAHPQPVPANTDTAFDLSLPTVNHVFLPGHRIMVQLQSSLFPLYDRNPQTYVVNIFWAKPADYRAQTITIHDGGAGGSSILLPLVH